MRSSILDSNIANILQMGVGSILSVLLLCWQMTVTMHPFSLYTLHSTLRATIRLLVLNTV
jgi:hypothetical protein